MSLDWIDLTILLLDLSSFLYAAQHCVSKYGSVLWYWTALHKHTWSVIRKVPLDDAMHMYNWTRSWPALMAPSNCHLTAAKDFRCWPALPLMSSPMVLYLSTPCEVRQQLWRSHHSSWSSLSTSEIWLKQHTVFSAQERIICNLHHILFLHISQNDVFSSNMGGSQTSFVYIFISP